ncbi:MAG: FkbM family methyltransferase [Myxococcales bacterium]|nr:FkbM family methyltransferase [Myxococcales bacterium]
MSRFGTVVKTSLRTFQVHFPRLLDTKFALMRTLRRALRIPFERDFEALSLFPIADDALLLDVGANRGQSTDAILLAVGNTRVQVHLFEPNELLLEKLKQLFGEDERIWLHGFGLGDEATESTLFVPFYRKWMFDGLASFDEDEARSWLRGRLYFYDERLLTLRESKCRLRTLDELGLEPFFMKIDVQGYEYDALKGGEDTLRAHEPILLVEAPDDLVIDFLSGIGYRYFSYERGKFRPGHKGRSNTYFMTAAKSRLVAERIS